jgi:hypothetical protein
VSIKVAELLSRRWTLEVQNLQNTATTVSSGTYSVTYRFAGLHVCAVVPRAQHMQDLQYTILNPTATASSGN